MLGYVFGLRGLCKTGFKLGLGIELWKVKVSITLRASTSFKIRVKGWELWLE